MPYPVRYKRAAAAEVETAISWYAQPEIDQAAAFVRVGNKNFRHRSVRRVVQ